MRTFIIFAISLAIALPAAARVTVAQLQQALTRAHAAHKSDAEVVRQIGTMELSERLTETRLELMTKNLNPGPQTMQALRLLADQSAFLDPPASELPGIAPPDDASKQRMLDAARNYVAQTLPRLPNFLATRTTNYFDDSPQQLGKNAWPIRAGLHLVGTSSREISVHDDQNALPTTANSKAKQETKENVMTSWGEFGSILAMIFGDVTNGKVNWSHWEQNAGSAVAVFNYSVPKTASHYVVVGTIPQPAPVEGGPGATLVGSGLKQGPDGSRTTPYRITPGYHGSLWLDPATGTILRITIETDLKDRDQAKRAGALVQYRPVTIGDHIFICPVRSLTLHMDAIDPTDTSGAAPLLKLNETQFIDYHRFASSARILTGTPPESASSAPVNSGPPESIPQVSPPANSDAVPAAEPTIDIHVESAMPAVATPAPTTAVLHVATNLVLEDVVVTDKGKTVHGLDRSRFHVLEDGQEQRIVAFDEHLPTTAPAPAARIATLPPNTYSNLPAYPESSALNVLLLDMLNTPEADMGNVQRKVAEYLGKSRPGASFAVFILSSRLRILVGFTSNIAELSQALKKKQESTTINSEMDKPAQEQYNNASLASGDAASRSKTPAIVLLQMRQAIEQTTAIHTDRRVQMTLDAVQKLARYLSAIPGRKNLIWFSASFPIALFPVKIDGLYSPQNRADSVRQTCDLLSAARVAVYPVDARGLVTERSFDIEGDAGSLPGQLSQPEKDAAAIHDNPNIAGRAPNVDPNFSGQTGQLGADHDSMQQIAEATGGRAFVNTNGLKEAVASAVEDGVSYYTVGYVPSKPPDGQFRRIQISLDNANYNLAYRRGYYADAVDTPSEHRSGDTSVLLAATQFGAPPSTQILFQARVLPANDPLLEGTKVPDGPAGEMSAALKGRAQRTIVDLTLDPHNLAFEESPDGSRKAQIEFTLVAYDANGKRVNYTDQGTIFNLKPEDYARVLDTNTNIPHRIALDLPAGQTFLRVVVYDLAAARVGSLEMPVTITGK